MKALIDGDVLLHSTIWGTTSLGAATEKLERELDNWTDQAFCDSRLICVGPVDGKNYRDDLYPAYKQIPSRVAGRKNRVDHYPGLKDYLYSRDEVVIADNIEADDLLAIYSTQLPSSSVIVSVDKDLDQVQGLHYNPRDVEGFPNGRYYTVGEETSLRFFLQQLLMGDSIDNIPGIPGLGPVKSERMLVGLPLETAASTVIDKYKETFGDDWLTMFLCNGKLLYLLRRDYEYFTFERFEGMYFGRNSST